ncbi:hypothetical protein [Sphingosinicella microcystinivorans]|uniref:hypothetical protein n=1 Tax=Sphingosinicella microcystinivorans TaxID=335406 RepID=UPI0022F396E8|nr:hypothetical protein [Sphingosinicella microcystinivorans]WBX83023.1 hypothetical protein PE061_14545 [Sphingosinicella microcystinivorans]
MKPIRKATAGIALLLSALALGGCMSDGYGRAGVSVGHGHYDRYGYDYPYYSGYGYGWYDGYYYPGSGYYVFDRHGKRHRWTARQRDYWANRGHDRKPSYDRDRRDRDRNRWRDRDRDGPRWNNDRDRRPNYARPDRDRNDRRRHDSDDRARERRR